MRDFACNTAFTRFETAISKKFEKQLQHFTEEEFRKLEELTELFEFLDSIIPLDIDEDQVLDAPRRSSRKRYFVHYYSNDWILIEELGDQEACLALRQKPLMVPRLRWKRNGDQNLSEWKGLGTNIYVDNLTRRPRLSPPRRSSRKRFFFSPQLQRLGID